MTPADHSADHRAAIIDGLLDLAALLEANPDLPTPPYIEAHVFPKGTDEEIRAEVDRLAVLLGTTIDADALPYGHYVTALSLGPTAYRVVGVLTTSPFHH
ncbi:hypothetical protein [Spongiactinospora sp. TRM90649]|uniref:hypothetical protein n=1 Tax=Spongiactinospora sp. TRM90649 TaxID=3031114 RepID=UPI0023F86E8E|nr:hypothetical protein [Spongiactinospora sp. TRM90649]MDF5757631.1 hypothetical protein [Spongiactinospora sp. TRM90649]